MVKNFQESRRLKKKDDKNMKDYYNKSDNEEMKDE